MTNIMGNRLREQLDGKTLTQAAEEIGLSQSVLSDIINGKKKSGINTATLLQICEHLHISADYLLGLSPTASLDVSIQSACQYTGLNEYAAECLHNILTDERDEFGPLRILTLSKLIAQPGFRRFLYDVASAIGFSISTPEMNEHRMRGNEYLSKASTVDELYEMLEQARSIVRAAGDLPIPSNYAAEYFRYASSAKLTEMLKELEAKQNGYSNKERK